jgi:hypothetical protein
MRPDRELDAPRVTICIPGALCFLLDFSQFQDGANPIVE